jgi:hypothetical protein
VAEPDLFIGVVSHARSRFTDSQGTQGLGARLGDALRRLDRSTELRVNTENLFDASATPLGKAAVKSSLDECARIENDWADFLLAGSAPSAKQRAAKGARWATRHWHRLRPPDERSWVRLANIELSHVDLLHTGLSSGAQWILILEDDAESADVADCAAGISRLMEEATSADFINLSQSFSMAELGIEVLLRPSGVSWGGAVARQVLAADRPITNTVCAILYQRPFVEQFVAELRARPLIPLVPIDWKMNEVLMHLYGTDPGSLGTCLIVTPGPIDQRSMLPTSGS